MALGRCACLAALLLCCQAAAGTHVYISIARIQNDWWKSVVSEFGGGCADGCATTSGVCECFGENANGNTYQIRWHQNKAQEQAWMERIAAEISGGVLDPTEVLVVAKHCSDNGGCDSNCESLESLEGETLPGGCDTQPAGQNDGRAFVPLLEENVNIFFLEYMPDLEWAATDTHAYSAVFGAALPAANEELVPRNYLVLQPDRYTGGYQIGRAFCKQTELEPRRRNIALLRGNPGHIGCGQIISGFEDGIEEWCSANNLPRVAWDFHANFFESEAETLVTQLVQLDEGLKTFISCNDDMAIGAIEAIKSITSARQHCMPGPDSDEDELRCDPLEGVIVTGCDNTTTALNYLRGKHESDAHEPPSMLASIDWRSSYVHSIRSLAQMLALSHGAAGAAPNSTLHALLPAGWVTQAHGMVETPVQIEVAQLCTHETPSRCPIDLKSILLDGPMNFNDEPCEGGTKFPNCWGFWWEPFASVVFLSIFLPMLPVAVKIVHVIVSEPGEMTEKEKEEELQSLGSSALRKRALEAGVEETAIEETKDSDDPRAGMVALVLELEAKEKSAHKSDTDRKSFIKHVLSTSQVLDEGFKFMGRWPYLFSIVTALAAAIQLRMRKSPTIQTNNDPLSPGYMLLEGWTHPSVCWNGFQDDSGVKYLSGLLGFLIVFRFVNLYGRRVDARGALGQHLTSLKLVATHVAGMVTRDPNEELHWGSPKVVGARHRIHRCIIILYMTLRLYIEDYQSHEVGEFDGVKRELNNLIRGDEKLFKAWERTVKLHEGKKSQDGWVRSFFFLVVAQLEDTYLQLAKWKLVGGNPMEGGQVTANVNGIVSGFTGAEKAIDIFRSCDGDKQPYPYIVAMIGRAVLICFCFALALVIGCKTSVSSSMNVFPYLGFAEILTFFITLAFSSLYSMATQLQNPYGDDPTDFNLTAFGNALNQDVGALLETSLDDLERSGKVIANDAHQHAALGGGDSLFGGMQGYQDVEAAAPLTELSEAALEPMKLEMLRKIALGAGITEAELDKAYDSADTHSTRDDPNHHPKKLIIAMLLKLELTVVAKAKATVDAAARP